MSLRRFLNVAYAMLIEEYQRFGTDLNSAIVKLEEALGLTIPTEKQSRPVPQAVAASNEASMALLEGMLKNVQNAPVRKPRKMK